MKRILIRTGAIASLFMLTISFVAAENICRERKLQCKEDAKKENGDYTPLERSNCRYEKLSCKAQQ